MLSIINCGLTCNNISAGITGDIVTQSEKNISNWTISGLITDTFSDNLNVIEFTNSGPASVANGIKNEFSTHFGLTITDAIAESIASEWASLTSDYKFYAYRNTGNQMVYILISNGFTSSLESQFMAGSVYINFTGDKYYYRSIYRPNKGTLDEWYQAQFMGQVDGYTGQFILPVYSEYMASLPHFEGNIVNDFTVIDGKNYLVRFKACSPSGFTKGSGNEIIFTSGTNSTYVNISATASETLVEYESIIESDGDVLNVEIDAVQFINVNGTEIDISDFEIYKLV